MGGFSKDLYKMGKKAFWEKIYGYLNSIGYSEEDIDKIVTEIEKYVVFK